MSRLYSEGLMKLGRLIQVTLWPLAMIPMEMKRSASALMNYVLSVRQIMYSYFSFFIIKWHTHTHTQTHTNTHKHTHTHTVITKKNDKGSCRHLGCSYFLFVYITHKHTQTHTTTSSVQESLIRPSTLRLDYTTF